MKIGTCVAKPGKMSFGHLEVMTHFDGTPERLPVIIAAGRHDGPCFWVTGNIHGDEYVGLLAVQGGVTRALADRLDDLHGTVVALPTLNPAGLRVGRREAYYDPTTDPNRTFPDANPYADAEPAEGEDDDTPTPYEVVSNVYFELMRQTAHYHVDLHAMSIQSTPFTLVDHLLYHGEDDRPRMEKLSAEMHSLARAFGVPVINEFPSRKYIKNRLHRSTGGAAVHVLGIPSITPELGMGGDVEPKALRAGIAGVHNALVWAKMLPDDPIIIDWIPQPDLGYPVRREPHPRPTVTGIAAKLVAPGDVLRAGDPVAELRDIWGRPLGDNGYLRTGKDGWVLNLRPGVGVYPNRAIIDLAVRDDDPLVLPWPK